MICHLYYSRYKWFNYKYLHTIKPNVVHLEKDFFYLFIFLLDDLWKPVVCFQPPSSFIEKVWVPMMDFCACPIHCKMNRRVGKRLGSCRLTSAWSLISSTIKEFSISSALWELGISSTLYWHSFKYQIDHSTLWWMAVGLHCLMLCQECRSAMFWTRFCSFCAPRSCFLFWRISWSVMSTLIACVLYPGVRVASCSRVPELCPRQGYREWSNHWGWNWIQVKLRLW